MLSRPEQGVSMHPRIVRKVVFPDPEGPSRATISPRSTVSEAPLSTVDHQELAPPQVGRIPLLDRPGQAPPRKVLKGIDDRVLGGTARLGDPDDPDDQVVCTSDAGDRPDTLHIGLRERARQVDVRGVPGRDP
jgi:hypothetical protein